MSILRTEEFSIMLRPGQGPYPTGVCLDKKQPFTGQVYELLEEMYGVCMFQAWHDDLLVGWIGFRPKGAFDLDPFTDCICHHEDDEEFSRIINDMRKVEADELWITCIQVRGTHYEKYLRKGIGKALVRDTIQWARIAGYRRIQVGPVYNDALHPEVWHEKASRSFWESLGFEVVEPSNQDESEAENAAVNFGAELMADVSDWQGQIAKDKDTGEEWPVSTKTLKDPANLPIVQSVTLAYNLSDS